MSESFFGWDERPSTPLTDGSYSGGIEGFQPGGIKQPIIKPARTDFTGYLAGKDTSPLSAQEVQSLYGGISSGSIKITPDQFSKVIQSDSGTKGLDVNEWSRFSPQYRQWATTNPQAFMTDLLAHRNPANQDLASVGAEGGYANPGAIKVTPQGTVDYSKAGYMDIHDQSAWTQLRDTAESAAAIVGNYFVPGSSLLTSHLVSKGSQEQLNSPVGKLAQLASGSTGSMVGNSLGTAVGNSGNIMDYSGTALKGAGALMGMTGGSSPGMRTTGTGQAGQQGGGGMALTDNITLGNLMGGLGGVADYATTGKQQDIMKGAYGQAQNLIMQPSAEQQQIRQKTMGMINDPSSFFQDPLYQAAFGQGQQALERSQSARGMLGSGGAATELQKYGQTFGMDMYQNRLAQLSGLSGIQQDPATRQIGAQTLLGGAGMQAQLLGNKTAALTRGAQDFLGGDPITNLLRGGGGLSNMPISQLYKTLTGGSDTSGAGSTFDPTGSYGGMDFSGMAPGSSTDFSGGGTGAISNFSDYTGTTDFSAFGGSPSDFLSSYFQ